MGPVGYLKRNENMCSVYFSTFLSVRSTSFVSLARHCGWSLFVFSSIFSSLHWRNTCLL